MSKFTPGPWALMDRGDYGDFDGRSQVVMSEELSGDNPFRLAAVHVNNEETAANARLIAAAPDLLEALTLLVRYFPTDTDMREVGCGDAHVNAACSAYDVARAVITKATGEQS